MRHFDGHSRRDVSASILTSRDINEIALSSSKEHLVDGSAAEILQAKADPRNFQPMNAFP